jgi:hypothetical protein
MQIAETCWASTVGLSQSRVSMKVASTVRRGAVGKAFPFGKQLAGRLPYIWDSGQSSWDRKGAKNLLHEVWKVSWCGVALVFATSQRRMRSAMSVAVASGTLVELLAVPADPKPSPHWLPDEFGTVCRSASLLQTDSNVGR